MRASVQTFLAGIIDYAGLFPPAKLPLDQAIRNYARYRQEPESWMLGRFVCPAARLVELAPLEDELRRACPSLGFSALGSGGNSSEEFVARLETDLKTINDFTIGHKERVVDVLEVRLPGNSVRGQAANPQFDLIWESARLIFEALLELTPFFEAPFKADWRVPAGEVIAAIAQDHEEGQAYLHAAGGRPAGFKLRCGGLEASAFPSPEQVAFVITACRDTGVPLKFTAGLHHPIRHYDAGLQTKIHGFLNVFGAGVLAHARRLSVDQVRRIIEAEDPQDFVFDDAGFHWKDFDATIEEIAAARQSAVISFGSCSFDEPRQDLSALGLLD
jgi:hypothetical protein